MKNFTKLFFTFLSLSLVLHLGAQPEEQSKKSSLELIAQIYGNNGITPLDGSQLSTLFMPSSSGVFFRQRATPEIQIRYIRELVKDVSVYGGLSYGINFFSSNIQIVSATVATSAFGGSIESIPNRHRISYGSAHFGIRYSINVEKNDALNISLGGKGMFYPSRDLGLTETGFSDVRGEAYAFNFETDSEDAESKFLAGLELDINFQKGFKNSPLKIMLGITVDRVTNSVRELNSQLVLGTMINDFRHSIGGGRVGVYLGVVYGL